MTLPMAIPGVILLDSDTEEEETSILSSSIKSTASSKKVSFNEDYNRIYTVMNYITPEEDLRKKKPTFKSKLKHFLRYGSSPPS